jgi:hypothetical protein
MFIVEMISDGIWWIVAMLMMVSYQMGMSKAKRDILKLIKDNQE